MIAWGAPDQLPGPGPGAETTTRPCSTEGIGTRGTPLACARDQRDARKDVAGLGQEALETLAGSCVDLRPHVFRELRERHAQRRRQAVHDPPVLVPAREPVLERHLLDRHVLETRATDEPLDPVGLAE